MGYSESPRDILCYVGIGISDFVKDVLSLKIEVGLLLDCFEILNRAVVCTV